jgi:Mn2+/Fe2+ NRAMP family transporter
VAAAGAGAGAGVTTTGASTAGALGFSPQAVRDNANRAATRAIRFIYFSFTIIKFTYKNREISVRYDAKLQRRRDILYH